MPSEGAWDRLDAMLTTAEGKKKRRFGWMYIAASLLGFSLILTWFFGSTKEMTDQRHDPGIVVRDTVDNAAKTNPAPALIVRQNTDLAGVVAGKPATKPTRIAPTPSSAQRALNTTLSESVVAQNPSNEIIHQKSEQIAPKPVSVDAAALLASVENNGPVSVPLSGKEKVKVDPKSLLSQVDGELDMTFREKALRSVSRNYQNVKVALSNRNNE